MLEALGYTPSILLESHTRAPARFLCLSFQTIQVHSTKGDLGLVLPLADAQDGHPPPQQALQFSQVAFQAVPSRYQRILLANVLSSPTGRNSMLSLSSSAMPDEEGAFSGMGLLFSLLPQAITPSGVVAM